MEEMVCLSKEETAIPSTDGDLYRHDTEDSVTKMSLAEGKNWSTYVFVNLFAFGRGREEICKKGICPSKRE